MNATIRLAILLGLVVALGHAGGNAAAAEIAGQYMETRSCQVYTGPCFANGEMGLAGKEALMAWSIREGTHNGVDLTGLKVVMALTSTTTLGHNGLDDGQNLKSVIYIDEKANAKQSKALVDFVKTHAGKAASAAVRVVSAPIQMELNEAELNGKLTAGKDVTLVTRKARPSDCLCSNETAFYPPLAQLQNFAAGVTSIGEFHGRGLGNRWSTPENRGAYMATFAY